MKNQTRRQHRWRQGLQWAAGVVVSLMVLVVVGTTIYVHVSPVPAMLTLPKDAGSGSGTVLSSGGVTGEGVWKAAPGSIVGWRVPQIFIGQQLPLVNRTGKVWGSITLSGGSVTRGTFTADMVALTSSLSKTTQHTVFDIGTYPTTTVTLTSPIALGTIPSDGIIERFPATANLTMHGVTHVVHFTVSVEHFSRSIYVLADITFPYGDWNISAQGVPFLADLQSPAMIEVLLHLTQGTGNTASVTPPYLASAGGPI